MSASCTFANKAGKACTYSPMGMRLLTRTSELNGVPYKVVAGKKFTGSNEFCVTHQIHEPWWPNCEYCSMSKVDSKAGGRTANCCRACIDSGAWREPRAFNDPILDVEAVSPSGVWVVKEKVKPVESDEIREARRAVKAAEDELARKIAEVAERKAHAEKVHMQSERDRATILAYIKTATPEALAVMAKMIP